MTKPELSRAQRPSAKVTRDRFLAFRAPRPGVFNGQRLTNPVWAWLAKSRLNGWQANAWFEGPSSMEVGPCWSADRFGQSRTELGDGRVVEIGGEHEDHYDPDFFIYNDVIVRGPKGALEVYGYPTHVFPPTDFHSASLVGGRLIVIGGVGYPADRRPDGPTPVFALDPATWCFERLETRGESPGWLSSHQATTKNSSVTVTGGSRMVVLEGAHHLVDSADDWRFEVKTGRWTRLTHRAWQQWSLEAVDQRHRSTLFQIGMLKYHVPARTDYDREQLAKWQKTQGPLPNFGMYDARYAPPVTFEALPQHDEHPFTHRIRVAGVVLRFVEHSGRVNLTIEGKLPPQVLRRVVEHVRGALTSLEGTAFAARRLQ